MLRTVTTVLMATTILWLPNIGYGAVSRTNNIELKINKTINSTWHLQRTKGLSLTPTNRSYTYSPSRPYRRWVLHHWIRERNKAERAPAVVQSVSNESAWQCIHNGEGAWNSNTGNGYYGGLQMDIGFQLTYGRALYYSKGTANNWTPAEQMQVAENARASGRGYYPWPVTARQCGLL